jgi:hypothetical protein
MNTDPDTTPTTRRRRTLFAGVLAAAAIALAIPVSGAFAGSGDESAANGDRAGHRGDCPKDRDRDRSSGTSVDPTREL